MTDGSMIYVADVEVLKQRFREAVNVEPKVWKCPCHEPRCQAAVLHARGVDGRFYFISNQTFKDKPPYNATWMDSIEDIPVFLASEVLPAGDLFVFGIWFRQGLKEAMFSDGEPDVLEIGT